MPEWRAKWPFKIELRLDPAPVENSSSCPFRSLPEARVLSHNESAIAIREAHPVAPGHTLVMPLRHALSFFDATPDERRATIERLDAAKTQLQSEFGPAGHHIGIHDGAAAGQPVGHLHIHPIPRYPGDVVDSRGGVGRVIPERADCWTGRR